MHQRSRPSPSSLNTQLFRAGLCSSGETGTGEKGYGIRISERSRPGTHFPSCCPTPRLKVAETLAPQVSALGRAGSGGHVPEPWLARPPSLPRGHFTIPSTYEAVFFIPDPHVWKGRAPGSLSCLSSSSLLQEEDVEKAGVLTQFPFTFSSPRRYCPL